MCLVIGFTIIVKLSEYPNELCLADLMFQCFRLVGYLDVFVIFVHKTAQVLLTF